MLRNLGDNAARHAAGRLGLSVAEGGGMVRLVVDDDGPGLPEADRERVFERFVRLDGAPPGPTAAAVSAWPSWPS